ncbi:unnamed protein product [Calypogeia fissa]
MAGGTPVLGRVCCSWQQEMTLPSTSNCAPSRSWTSPSRCNVYLIHSSDHGKCLHEDVARAISCSWSWCSTFSSCQLRCSLSQIVSRRRRVSRIASESMDDDDTRNNEVRTFIKTLRPGATKTALDESLKGKPFWTWNPLEMLVRIADHADAQTEMGMKRKGAFYRAEDWFKHRSSKRHLRHILSTFKSRVIISLIPPVTALTAMSALVALYNTLVEDSILPSFLPVLHTSSLPYQLTAPALALLLVFRTEASYSRYDEGRKTWTKVFACTKDFSRQCLAWIQNPLDSYRRMDLLHYIMAFPVALKCHLLDGSDVYEDLKLLLDEEDLAVVMNSAHRPNCLLQLMTQSLALVDLTDSQRGLMEANITEFNHSISVCERITRTPIPLSYTRLTSRALILWHLTLPLVLWDDCKWMTVFATFFSSSTLFCIEEVGVLIEEPFSMLSLDNMCAVAHQCVQELVELSRVTEKHLKTKENMFRNAAGTGTGAYARVPSNGVPPSS